MRPPRTQQHTARVRTEGEAILDSPPLAAHTVAPGSWCLLYTLVRCLTEDAG